jgi:hypothetical protein
MAWHKLTIIDQIFHCEAGGSQCLTHVAPDEPAFLEPQMKKEIQDQAHDESLTELTKKINQLLTEAAQKRTDRNLRITKTTKGLVVMWTQKGSPGRNDTQELTDNEILEVLGLN